MSPSQQHRPRPAKQSATHHQHQCPPSVHLDTIQTARARFGSWLRLLLTEHPTLLVTLIHTRLPINARCHTNIKNDIGLHHSEQIEHHPNAQRRTNYIQSKVTDPSSQHNQMQSMQCRHHNSTAPDQPSKAQPIISTKVARERVCRHHTHGSVAFIAGHELQYT